MEKGKIDMTGLPKWEMGNDGLITASALQHQRALLYTFVETALAHNDRQLEDLKEEKARTVKIEMRNSPALEPNPASSAAPTKQEVNLLLSGAFNLVGTRRWWQRPLKSLDMKTPHEAWETDPQRVWDVARERVNLAFRDREKND